MKQISAAERQAQMPKKVTLTTEDGTVLEEVGEHDLPEMYDPTRRGESE